MVRYGVFNVGQIWFVVGEAGAQLGFPSRRAALDAAWLMLNADRAGGEAVEILAQDDIGRLSVMTEAPPQDEPPLRMRPARVSLHVVD
jgi:hypothetical protein